VGFGAFESRRVDIAFTQRAHQRRLTRWPLWSALAGATDQYLHLTMYTLGVCLVSLPGIGTDYTLANNITDFRTMGETLVECVIFPLPMTSIRGVGLKVSMDTSFKLMYILYPFHAHEGGGSLTPYTTCAIHENLLAFHHMLVVIDPLRELSGTSHTGVQDLMCSIVCRSGKWVITGWYEAPNKGLVEVTHINNY